MKKILLYIPLLVIIPIGLISKILYFFNKGLNYIVIGYQKYINGKKLKLWQTISCYESHLGAWEIVNNNNNGVNEPNIDFKFYSADDKDNEIIIKITSEELTDLIDFTRKINKNVIK